MRGTEEQIQSLENERWGGVLGFVRKARAESTGHGTAARSRGKWEMEKERVPEDLVELCNIGPSMTFGFVSLPRHTKI
ncbi:hypothetical protein E2542_SST14099 [Spatholobus suberectus]|nr:hypothetical protein E2542_SST14099 [Spatholobus suberectus]